MADLQAIADLARRKGLNFTGPLSHRQAEALAKAWRPEVRFHEEERFHPVDIDGLFEIPAAEFDTLSASEQTEFAIEVDGTSFDPPVLRNGSSVIRSGEIEATDLDNAAIDSGTILTHGKSFRSSNEFFGSKTIFSENMDDEPDNPDPGHPRMPLHSIVYRAEMRMLYEALKFELELDDLNEDEERPIDSIWRGFDVTNSFFREDANSQTSPGLFPHSLKRQILKGLVDTYDPENPDFAADNVAVNTVIAAMPEGWLFVRNAWEVIKNFAFVEYMFVYPYNDFDRYESPFGNKHEGDDEGCCVVFDRNLLNAMANDDQANPPESIAPHAFITSVHEEWQGGDRIDDNISVVPERARDDLIAYVARGSHATYLDAGTHDVLDFGDAFLLPFNGPTWVSVINALTLGSLGLILAIGEKFAESEDKTSNDGISTPGPEDASTDEELVHAAKTVVTALSDINEEDDDNNNIYKSAIGAESDPSELAALGRRAYAGKIGAHEFGGPHNIITGDFDDISSRSPHFQTKTARYFRKLLRAVNEKLIHTP